MLPWNSSKSKTFSNHWIDLTEAEHHFQRIEKIKSIRLILKCQNSIVILSLHAYPHSISASLKRLRDVWSNRPIRFISFPLMLDMLSNIKHSEVKDVQTSVKTNFKRLFKMFFRSTPTLIRINLRLSTDNLHSPSDISGSGDIYEIECYQWHANRVRYLFQYYSISAQSAKQNRHPAITKPLYMAVIFKGRAFTCQPSKLQAVLSLRYNY